MTYEKKILFSLTDDGEFVVRVEFINMNSPIMTSRGKLYISQNESVHRTFQTHSTIFIGQFQVVIR